MKHRLTALVLSCLLLCWLTAVGRAGEVTEKEFRAVAALMPGVRRCGNDGARGLYYAAVRKMEARPGATKLALKLLGDKDYRVRNTCFLVLRDLRPKGQEKVILAAIKKEGNRRVRQPALMALSVYRNATAADGLLECLTALPKDDLPYVLRALGWVQQPKVAPRIVGYLGKPECNDAVLKALIQSGNPKVVPQIRASLDKISAGRCKEEMRGIRRRQQKLALDALWVLHRDKDTFDYIARQQQELKISIGPHHEYRRFFHPDVLPEYVIANLDGSFGAKDLLAGRYIAQVFGTRLTTREFPGVWKERYKRVGNKVVPLLLDCAAGSDPVISREALRMLSGRVAHTSAAEKKTIRAALRKLALSNNRMPLYFFSCLLVYRDSETADLLMRLAGDPDKEKAVAAAGALVSIDRKQGVKKLRRFLAAKDERIALRAAWTLVSEGDSAGLPRLFKAAEKSERAYAENYASLIARHLKTSFNAHDFRKDRAKELKRLKAIWKAKRAAGKPR